MTATQRPDGVERGRAELAPDPGIDVAGVGPTSRRGADAPRSLPRVGGPAFWLSGALAVVGASAAAWTFFGEDVLGGPAVSAGSARGTALVVLVVAVPTLIAAVIVTTRGIAKGTIVWLGATGYLLYNAQLFLYGTPFNQLFLGYVALLSLAFWTIVAVIRETDVRSTAWSAGIPVRAVSSFVIVVVALNALLWLRGIIPAISGPDPASIMAGSGMTTNPVYIQDLAFWFPLAVLGSVQLWRRRPIGALIVGSLLTLWVIESIGIATDQWFGHAADPSSALASSAVVPPFVALAAVTLIPLAFVLRSPSRGGGALFPMPTTSEGANP
jgi:hypothetical protein